MGLKDRSPPYKGESGAFLTRGLFYEADGFYDPNAVFSFKGKEGYIDARKTFVELDDPTGYQWAVKYLGSVEHWERLVRCSWFKEQLAEWVAEIELKAKSEAIRRLKEIAAGESAQAISAAKYLATLDYNKGARGRPSKNEIQGELKRQAALLEEQESDAERIGLKVIK